MKVAGSLLSILGVILVVTNILFQNSTGRNMNGGAVLIGAVMLIVGIVLYNIKPKNKDNKE